MAADDTGVDEMVVLVAAEITGFLDRVPGTTGRGDLR